MLQCVRKSPPCPYEKDDSILNSKAAIAQLGERQTEDLEVPGSIPGLGILAHFLDSVRLYLKNPL